jgi:hypothetical protein
VLTCPHPCVVDPVAWLTNFCGGSVLSHRCVTQSTILDDIACPHNHIHIAIYDTFCGSHFFMYSQSGVAAVGKEGLFVLILPTHLSTHLVAAPSGNPCFSCKFQHAHYSPRVCGCCCRDPHLNNPMSCK